MRTAYGTSDAVLEQLRNVTISLHGTFVGRAAFEARPIQIADMHGLSLDVHQQVLHDAGWRSMLAIPMLREGQIVGVFVVRRKRAGDFPQETEELLQTFAGQSALAILNARLFRELERKSTELEVVSRHKSEFLASMSHELRTPLNAVIGFSEVLLDRMFGEINDRQEEYLRDIWSSGKHLLALLSEILDLSKVEAGRMEMEKVTFSVPDALEYGLSMIRERAAAHGLALILDVDPEVGDIETDELRFKQVVLNLLSNAVKFTPDGGEIVVAAKVEGDDFVITVADTGVGVAPEDCERIFESFQQGSRGALAQEGTGLGLTLSRRIVGLMGGQMWLDSELGVGSTFGFTVPTGPQPLPDGGPSRAPVELGSATVVVIDDDRPSTDLLTVYLESAGFKVSSAQDGPSGLDYAKDYATVVRLGKAIPSTLDMPSLLVQLESAAKGTGIDFDSITVGERTTAAAPAATSADEHERRGQPAGRGRRREGADRGRHRPPRRPTTRARDQSDRQTRPAGRRPLHPPGAAGSSGRRARASRAWTACPSTSPSRVATSTWPTSSTG